MSDSPAHAVHVIIVTYEGEDLIGRCLASLAASHCPVHVIVVDNASTDGTRDVVRRDHPEVELIESPENLGFGAGCNIGLRRVFELGARHVLLLNQDAAVEPGTLEELLTAFDDEAVGIATPMHLAESGDKLDYVFSNYLAPGRCPNLLSDLYLGRAQPIYRVDRTNAAVWLLSRECLERVGGFDPVLPHYGEDDDYINRLHYHGLEVVVVPRARATHESRSIPYETLRWDRYRLFINSLVTLKDIRRGFVGLVFAHFIGRTYEAVKALVTLRFRRARDIVLGTGRAAFALTRVARSRRRSREGRRAYL